MKWGMRKLCAIMCVWLLICSRMENTFAHPSDYAGGSYLSTAMCDQSLLKFQVHTSAQTNLLTSEVYGGYTEWDGISSEVDVYVIMYTSGMPSTGFYQVLGEVYSSSMLGKTVPRDAEGNIVSLDSDWNSVTIYMNTLEEAYSKAENATQAARGTFLHELGHSLKLTHPAAGSSYALHWYNGYPKAVMNSGYSAVYASSSVTDHDRMNLVAKWGK